MSLQQSGDDNHAIDAAVGLTKSLCDAMTDERGVWPGKAGTANGPRFAAAVADRFAAGESILELAGDYDIAPADVMLAVRDTLRTQGVLLDRITAPLNAYDERVALGGNNDAWRAIETGASARCGCTTDVHELEETVNTLEDRVNELNAVASPTKDSLRAATDAFADAFYGDKPFADANALTQAVTGLTAFCETLGIVVPD